MSAIAVRPPVRLAAEPTALTFMTFEAVELAHVGMDWPAASGPVTLTFQHLQDAVTAENADPHIVSPRLKIGHDDPRFNESPAEYDPFAYHGPLREDGSPVYGKATNLRLSEDGMVLLADYVEVPSWLGDSLPSAYPSRSIEGDFDVQTKGGKHYSFVITAVSLLGEPLPAISCLDDLVRELSGGPEAVLQQAPVTLRRDAMPVSAEASTDAVRSQFFDEFAQGDRYWWWPAELRLDAGWVLADDDEGHLYRVPFTVDADGNVTFGDPLRGVLDFRPVPDTETPEGAQPVAASRAVRFANAADAGRPKSRVRAATKQKGAVMATVIEKLREKLGLGDDTPEETLIAKLDEAKFEQPEPDEPETPPTAPPTDPEPDEPAAEKDAAETKLLQHANEQLAARVDRLETELAAKATAETKTRRDTIVATAMRDGQIRPDEHDLYRANLDINEEATLKVLAALPKGRVPARERGSAPAAATADTGLAWFPQFDTPTAKEAANHG